MPVTVNQILTYLGIDTAAHRAIISADLMPNPGKLENLLDETEEGIKDTCLSYNRGDPGDRIRISRSVVKKLVSLMHWAKDKHRVNERIEFPNGTDQMELLQQIADATVREQCRKTQKKAGEALITHEFNSKLKNSAQWERWKVEFKSTLSSIIGAKGIPLSYVIRENDDQQLLNNAEASWDEKFVSAVSLTGPEFNIDKMTVHQIILRNVAEDSDAYTYLKPRIRDENGRTDIKALRLRYENQATQQEKINEANRILETLVYKNERAMSFELFSSKLQGAVDTLQECGRTPHDGDIVDRLWNKILNSELNPFVEALKVQYNQNPRTYREILQDIATQVPNLRKTNFRRNISEVKSVDGFTREGQCPTEGVFTSEGKFFIGTYPGSRWFDEDVKPHHGKIREIRKNNPKGGKGFKRPTSKVKRSAKRKIKKLKTKIAELEQINTHGGKSRISNPDDGNTVAEVEIETDAGTAFGGRNAKKKAKISKTITINRTCKQVKSIAPVSPEVAHVDPTELDSHADTIVAGRNTILMSYTDRVCDVSPYWNDYKPVKDVPIVTATTGYT